MKGWESDEREAARLALPKVPRTDVPVGTSVEIRFLAPDTVESVNAVDNWFHHRRATWRAAWIEGCIEVWDQHAEELATIAGCYLTGQMAFPTERWKDHDNAAPQKPVCDSLVRSGLVLRDDSPTYYGGTKSVFWKPATPGLCVVRLTVARPSEWPQEG